MDNDKTNFTNKPENIEWFTSTSASDEDVKQFCCAILERPANHFSMNKLYTEEQVIQAFRKGVSTITDTEIWKKFVAVNKYWGKSVYRIMRQMNVGDIKEFPYQQWSAARVAASKLKAEFGCIFQVTKKSYYGTEGEIQVRRIK